MKQLLTRTALFSILMIAAVNVWAVNVADAQTLIKNTTDKVLETLKNDSRQLNRLVDKVVLPHFDFRKMSRLVLGKHWKTVYKKRKRFITAFRGLLVRTYTAAFVKVAGKVRKIKYSTSAKGLKKAMVSAKVYQHGVTKPLKVDYFMFFNKRGKWKVYNIVVSGVSLVTNYRSEFSKDIKTIGIEELIKKIKRQEAKKIN